MSYTNPLTYDQVKEMTTERLLAYYKKHRGHFFALQHANGDFDGEMHQRAFYEGVEMTKSELNLREHVDS